MKTRKAAAEKAVQTKFKKSGKHTCAFCHQHIVIGGIRREGYYWHRSCYNRKKVAEIRESTAVRR